MSKPSPQAIVSELDWIFLWADPNPLFRDAAELIKELYIENEMMRRDRGLNPPERSFGTIAKWE